VASRDTPRTQGGRNLDDLLCWRLVPNWVKAAKGWPQSINARCFAIQSKPSFPGAYMSRRCLMPVELFFEWMKIHGPGGELVERHKQPYVIAMADRRPFALPAF
jgi:putative SOS response-associated peptidase YedK